MIVRTYVRRSRSEGQAFSDGDSPRDDEGEMRDGSLSLSQGEACSSQADPYGFAAFSSQGSSTWSFDCDRFGTDGAANISLPPIPPPSRFGGNSKNNPQKTKDRKNTKSKKVEQLLTGRARSSAATSTLMEAQEFGEMMEHADEVTFALDGLRRGQNGRIRQASLHSLLTICESAQQRRLLRARGMSKKIIDAITSLAIDDSPCSVAAAALFYVLATDVPDDYLIDSPDSVHFLLRLLNPRVSDKESNSSLGCKKTGKSLDLSSTAVMPKVQEILSSCEVLKNGVIGRSELSTKWIALLTIEKACLSAVSIQDASGAVRSVGGNFKERLRKFGGLDAIFDVAVQSYSRMEGRLDHGFSMSQEFKSVDTHSIDLLLKCFKIMENATFMSSDNQNHLLKMKANVNDKGPPLSFVGLIISAIKIFSDVSLRIYPRVFIDNFGQDISSQKSKSFQKRQKLTSSNVRISSVRDSGGWISINIGKTKISDQGVKSARDPFAFDEVRAEPPVDPFAFHDVSAGPPADPFAFEEDDVGPTKWEMLAKRKDPTVDSEVENPGSYSYSADDGSTVLEESLLTAVKVLMNLTNDNPEGCRQIASCGGLDALVSLIGRHFPSFDFFQMADSSSVDSRSPQTNKHPSDRLGLDFLVVILGLLVNLVEKDNLNRSRLASASVPVVRSGGKEDRGVISFLCSIFLSNRGSYEASGEEKPLAFDDEFALMQGEKEAEMMIIEAYAALLLAFLSTESVMARKSIAECLPDGKLEVLVPVLERFVAFHVSLNMISPETHQIVAEVIESCRDF